MLKISNQLRVLTVRAPVEYKISFIFLGVLVGVGLMIRSRVVNREPLNVVFPVGLLKQDISLLDPENTESIWEYYLLENIGCGLVRDSQDSSLGYVGCLSEKFYQEDSHTWVFYLRDLRWSDGMVVAPSEILEWMNDLRSKPHRHIRYLKRVDEISFEPTLRKLTLKFPFKIGISILHELSLADAVLLPSEYKILGWQKTVGPYYVEKWDIENRVLQLASNAHSPLYRVDMPDRIVLKNVSTMAEKFEYFTKHKMDIVPSTSFTDPRLLSSYERSASQTFNGHPSSILFLCFNHLNPMTYNVNVRLQIAKIVAQFRNGLKDVVKDKYPLVAETQMIPFGFNGRLEGDHSDLSVGDQELEVSKIRIRVPKQLELYSELMSYLSSIFKKNGIILEVNYSDETSNEIYEEFGRLVSFVGNQQDSSGSWSFLLGPPLGPLSSWLPDLKKEFDDIYNQSGWEEQLEASRRLHRKILYGGYAIPLLTGRIRHFLSSRVDASRWNRFDARLRFYELGLK